MLLGVGLIVFIHMQIWNRTRLAQSQRLKTNCRGRPRPYWTCPFQRGQIACKCGCRRIRLLVKSSWRTPCQRARWSWAQTLEPLKNVINPFLHSFHFGGLLKKNMMFSVLLILNCSWIECSFWKNHRDGERLRRVGATGVAGPVGLR